MRRLSVVLTVVALLAAGCGVLLLSRPGWHRVTVAGVPLYEVRPSGAGPRPGVVVAHGFSGSAKLMEPFADSLAARGYVVVLLDFTGHGANTHRLRDNDDLQRDLGVAVAHLRGMSDVDPARVALVGHSMGATAVTRYAAEHPEITTTVALSLPDAEEQPARVLLLYGGLEFPAFRTAAGQEARGGAGRKAVEVPGVEHISILYSARAHRATVDWIDTAFFGAPQPQPLPWPGRRIAGACLLMLAFFAGFGPLARLLLRGARRDRPRFDRPVIARAALVAVVAAVPAMVLARWVPLPLDLGGYVAGLVALIGVALLIVRPVKGMNARGGAAPLLILYSGVAIALPLNLGVTHAVPVGDRWWLLPTMWGCFALLAFGAERITGGNSIGTLAVSAVVVLALAVAAVAGLTSGFVLLVVPLLAVLMLWQAIWGAVLNRLAAPAWLIALTGSLVVAWPIAVALPLTR